MYCCTRNNGVVLPVVFNPIIRRESRARVSGKRIERTRRHSARTGRQPRKPAGVLCAILRFISKPVCFFGGERPPSVPRRRAFVINVFELRARDDDIVVNGVRGMSRARARSCTLLMSRCDWNGRDGGEEKRFGAGTYWSMCTHAHAHRVISGRDAELRCALTVSVGRSQLNFNFPDATNFCRNRLGGTERDCVCTRVLRRRRTRNANAVVAIVTVINKRRVTRPSNISRTVIKGCPRKYCPARVTSFADRITLITSAVRTLREFRSRYTHAQRPWISVNGRKHPRTVTNGSRVTVLDHGWRRRPPNVRPSAFFVRRVRQIPSRFRRRPVPTFLGPGVTVQTDITRNRHFYSI